MIDNWIGKTALATAVALSVASVLTIWNLFIPLTPLGRDIGIIAGYGYASLFVLWIALIALKSMSDEQPIIKPIYITRYIEKPRLARSTAGYVYILKSHSGRYKIGYTSNPENRLHTFEVKLPFEVKYEHLIWSEDARKLEHDLHRRYADKRLNGEWFALNVADIEWIKTTAHEAITEWEEKRGDA